MATAAPATGAAPGNGPEATARALVAAIAARDAARVCGLLADGFYPSRRECRALVRGLMRIATIERAHVGRPTIRGGHARLVVDLVSGKSLDGGPQASRSRVLLARAHGHWKVVDSGTLLGLPIARRGAPDPVPAGDAAALRRLADDTLLAISGNRWMVCGLLAPGAPLGGRQGGCHRFSSPLETRMGGLAARLGRYAAHITGPGRARLELTVLASRAVPAAGRRGWALRTLSWADTLFAVRTAGRWRLVKPSRSFYRGLGVAEPTDVSIPAATVTWPMADAALPSITERPVPARCRTPPAVWAASCSAFDSVAFAPRVGGGLVAWSTGFTIAARPVAAAAPTAGVMTPDPPSSGIGSLWTVLAVEPVADGALLIEVNESNLAVRAVPVDGDGRSRGPAQLLDGGHSNPDDGTEPTPVLGPVGAAAATVVLGTGELLRLGADGRRVAPSVPLAETNPEDQLVAQPDGSLLVIGPGDAGIGIRRIGPDGRFAGAEITQPVDPGEISWGSVAAAVDGNGRVLAAWVEDDGRGHAAIRAWAYDLGAPLTATPTTVSTLRVRRPKNESSYDAMMSGNDAIALGVLPGGGWAIAWDHNEAVGADAGLWAARLDPAGAPAGPRARLAAGHGNTDYGGPGFGLAGDTVAWIAPPAVAGLPQIRAAPVP
ncbi:MAG: hypothetical protein ABUM26_00465 [Solirubrobacterales bacterium]